MKGHLRSAEDKRMSDKSDWNGLEWRGRVLAGSNLNVFDCRKHSDNLDEIGTSASKQKKLLRVCESNISFY